MDSNQIRRCEQLWFHDGSIVLQAGSVLFRVHQTILATQSPFFANLFEVPQPPEAEAYDGCPVIALYDSEEEARMFLLALSDRRYPRSFDDEHITATLLHMSSKYEAHGLRAQILEYLQPYFPTTLEGWWAKKRSFSARTPFSEKGAIIALANAAEHAAPHLLPAAFLQLNRYFETHGQWHIGELNGAPVALHPSLMVAFWSGRKRLGKLTEAVVYPRMLRCMPDDSNVIRQRWYECEPGRAATVRRLQRVNGCIMNPFEFSKDKPAWDPMWFCAICLENLEHDYRVGTRQVWQQLPEVFGLPSWDVLLEQEKD